MLKYRVQCCDKNGEFAGVKKDISARCYYEAAKKAGYQLFSDRPINSTSFKGQRSYLLQTGSSLYPRVVVRQINDDHTDLPYHVILQTWTHNSHLPPETEEIFAAFGCINYATFFAEVLYKECGASGKRVQILDRRKDSIVKCIG